MAQVKGQTMRVIAQKVVGAPIELHDDTVLRTLGFDSISIVDLLVALEDEFGFLFDVSALNLNSLKTTSDLIALCEQTVAAKESSSS